MKVFGLHVLTGKGVRALQAAAASEERDKTAKQFNHMVSQVCQLRATLKMVVDRAKRKGFKL